LTGASWQPNAEATAEMDALLEAAFTDIDPNGFSEQLYMQWARAHPMALAFVDTVSVLHFLVEFLLDLLG